MSAVDPWAPAERDWKEFLEQSLINEDRAAAQQRTTIETDCPSCGRHVGALIVDGPDPDFADVQCHPCGHVWNERAR